MTDPKSICDFVCCYSCTIWCAALRNFWTFMLRFDILHQINRRWSHIWMWRNWWPLIVTHLELEFDRQFLFFIEVKNCCYLIYRNLFWILEYKKILHVYMIIITVVFYLDAWNKGIKENTKNNEVITCYLCKLHLVGDCF